jgi:quercetin dioxygenase-like cupin family protein
MKRIIFTLAAAVAIGGTAFAAQEQAPGPKSAERKPVGLQLFRDTRDDPGASASHFIGGKATVSRFKLADAPFGCGIVSFDAGEHTRWHSHPYGQLLIVTAGSGWIQSDGGPVRDIRVGDLIWTPPDVRHWHGATSASSMSHASVSVPGSREVHWQEAPLYRGPGTSDRPESTARTADAIVIYRDAGASPRDASARFSGGAAALTPAPMAGSNLGSAIVAFRPNGRAHWSSHPTGQLLIVTSGQGWVRAEGEPARIVGQGEVVWAPPGVRHWYGATRATPASYAVISAAGPAQASRPVTEAEFTGP